MSNPTITKELLLHDLQILKGHITTRHLSYSVHYETESSYSCDENCATYCRCGKLVVTGPVTMDIMAAVRVLSTKCGQKKHNKNIKVPADYTRKLELILASLLKDVKPGDLLPRIINGYYGQEADGADLSLDAMRYLQNGVDELLPLVNDDTRLVRALLIREYGYILPVLTNSVFKLEKVKLRDIKLPADRYAKKIEPTSDEYPAILGVVRGDNSLVDGYHRYARASSNGANRSVWVFKEQV